MGGARNVALDRSSAPYFIEATANEPATLYPLGAAVYYGRDQRSLTVATGTLVTDGQVHNADVYLVANGQATVEVRTWGAGEGGQGGLPAGGAAGQTLTKTSALDGDAGWQTPAAVSVPDADATTKGKIQLAGDLGGTAASPTVPGLVGKQDADGDLAAIAGATFSNDDLIQRKAGVLTNRTPVQFKADLSLAKGDVGLGNVDNTTDAGKPLSTAAVTALGLKQDADADLAAIAGLTSAANKLPYFTGLGTASLADLTAAGRALLDDPDAAAQLTTLGVSTFIKTLLDDADAAAARGTLGLGSVDNTTDVAKPVSTATQTALNAKAGVSDQLVTFSRLGALLVNTGTARLTFPYDITLESVLISVSTAPTGTSIIVDVSKNGTTVFTTQANRPTILTDGFASEVEVPDVTSLALGDYLTIDVDQIGSAIAGSDLTGMIRYRRT